MSFIRRPIALGALLFSFLFIANGVLAAGTIKLFILDSGAGAGISYASKTSVLADVPDPSDVYGHGTKVAKAVLDTISAIGANVELHSIKTLDDNGEGSDFELAQGIRQAVDSGADVVNISSGCTSESPCSIPSSVRSALDYARSKGVVIVMSAGNTSGAVNPYEPEPGVITVGGLVLGCVDPQLSGNTPATKADFYASEFGSMGGAGTSLSSPSIAARVAAIKSEPVGVYDTNGNGTWDLEEIKTRLKDDAKKTYSDPNLSLDSVFIDGDTLFANGGCAPGVRLASDGLPERVPPQTSNPAPLPVSGPVNAARAAETDGFGGPLVPSCAETGPFEGACQLCNLVQLAQNLINFAVTFSVVVATLMFVYAGFLYFTASAKKDNITKAHKIFSQVFIGLIFVLGAWLIVDLIVSTLLSDDFKKLGPWNKIECSAWPTSTGVPVGGTGGIVGQGGGGTAPDGVFDYDGGVITQLSAASPALDSLLRCMAGKVPGNVGRISAISDLYSGTDSTRIAHCAAVGRQGDSSCGHSVNSCHYGGKACVGKSYAVDFGDGDPEHPTNLAALREAASACGANYMTDNEGGVRTHLHVSVGASCGCN